MKRRDFCLGAAALLASASFDALAAITAGKDYLVIKNGQPSQPGDKIEVLEAFSYMCPHCHEFEPKINAWSKRLPGDVVFRRMPVVFGRNAWQAIARAYYAAEAAGQLDKLHGRIFAAIHNEKTELGSEAALLDWVGKQGVDKQKFVDAYKSFGVASKLQRANALANGYAISGVPTIIVQGKYQTSGTQAGSHEGMLSVTDQLIDLVRKEKGQPK